MQRKIAAAVVMAGWLTGCQQSSPGSAPATSVLPPPPPKTAVELKASYRDVVKRVAPAVVTIHSRSRVRAAEQYPFFEDPLLREFFGYRAPREDGNRVREGLGSGVIVSQDGYILTNHHVVDGAQRITVEFSDTRSFPAKLVGSDPPSDLAVLKIEAHSLPTLTLADSDDAQVGDIVLAVGNPLGVGQTVTMGILSAKGRSTSLGDGNFEDFLQMDAPINQGNSGGALVNVNGELIGINSQILSASGGNIGIGFAIPANMARNVSEQLISNGVVRRGMLGVHIQKVDSDLAATLGLKQAQGALVNSVTANGPADRAGVKRGDVITKIDNRMVTDANMLRNLVARSAPGSSLQLTIWRDGSEQMLSVQLAELPTRSAQTTAPASQDEAAPAGRLGVAVRPLDRALTEQLGLPSGTEGLVILRVEPGSPAADAGLQEGDVIQEVNRRPVNSGAELSAALKSAESRPALLLVVRRGQPLYLPVRTH